MIIVILVLLGLCMGSFVNALVFRLFMQSKKSPANSKQSTAKNRKTDSRQQNTDYSIVHGRSMCVDCHHTLAWYDLLPVLSWAALRGKCRYCKKKISWQYPLVETLTAGLFWLSYVNFGNILQPIGWSVLSLWLIVLTILIALAVYDIKWMILPDRLVAILTFLAIGLVLLGSTYKNERFVVQILPSVLGGLLLAGLFYAIFQLSKGKWIGGGDVKIAFALGILAGSPLKSMALLFLASFIGTILALPLLIAGKSKMKSKLAFGPLLIAATYIMFVFGPNIDEAIQNYLYI